jgi:hypothetical protein
VVTLSSSSKLSAQDRVSRASLLATALMQKQQKQKQHNTTATTTSSFPCFSEFANDIRDVQRCLVEQKTMTTTVTTDAIAATATATTVMTKALQRSRFHHGSALCMAECDALLRFSISKPAHIKDTFLTVADVSGIGASGCSEYLLWRRKTMSNATVALRARGWALSSSSSSTTGNDDDDDDTTTAQRFTPIAREQAVKKRALDIVKCGGGSSRTTANGLITPDNIRAFAKAVRAGTANKGVHLVCFEQYNVASTPRDESLHRFLAAVSCMLETLAPGGSVYARVFDVGCPDIVGVLYVLRLLFEYVHVVKPAQPACGKGHDGTPSCIVYCFALKAAPPLALRHTLLQNVAAAAAACAAAANKSKETKQQQPVLPLSTLASDKRILADTAFVNGVRDAQRMVAVYERCQLLQQLRATPAFASLCPDVAAAATPMDERDDNNDTDNEAVRAVLARAGIVQ